MHHPYDKAVKWLIQNFGGALLRIGGIRNIVFWRPLQAELVNPAQLPDGLIEVQIEGEPAPRYFVLELATYPEQRLYDQVARDLTSVFLNRRELPETLVLVLHPKGRLEIDEHCEVVSRGGWGRMSLYWKTVNLQSIPAEDLLATGELGIIPWVPLSSLPTEPEPVLRECRRRIDEQATPDQHQPLLAVTQFLARLRFNEQQLWDIFGGAETMLEIPFFDKVVSELADKLADKRAEKLAEQRVAPIVQELEELKKLVAEGTKNLAAEQVARKSRNHVLSVLRGRFGPSIPSDIATELEPIRDEARLDQLVEWAAICPNLDSFHSKLAGDDRSSRN
jgi:hypothetical protein